MYTTDCIKQVETSLMSWAERNVNAINILAEE